jgi:hypothetical protein
LLLPIRILEREHKCYAVSFVTGKEELAVGLLLLLRAC